MTDPAGPTDDRWERLSRLLDDAAALPPAERDAFLDGHPPDLRAEVEALLAADDDASAFFDGLGDALAPDVARIGMRLGPWRIVGELGRGGMGTVYRAVRDDGAYDQEAALKVLDSVRPDVVARFRRERQILARLDHPSVARLLDGGETPEGRPYLVMELVRGEPITNHATHHALDVDARLDLFVQVCEAVQAAHRQLIVHRDLKPSNVFVVDTEDGPRVKLLDFGIARLLEDDADGLLTLTEHRALTPEYAAPEQVRGEPPTTATDVYALGVLLYELLAGTRPFDVPRQLAHEAARIVLEEEPERPSTAVTRAGAEALAAPRDEIRQRLEGDLDAVCLKALRKEPERRYATADALGRDLDRHLRGLTVEARPDTVRYRASRFVRRHRRALAGAALALVGLVGGLGAALWKGAQARAEAARAERLAEFTLGLFATQDPFSTEALPDSVTFAHVVRLAADRAETELTGPDRLRVMAALGAAGTAVGRGGSLDIHRRVHALAVEAHGPESAEAIRAAGALAWALMETEPSTADSLYAASLDAAERARLGPETTASLRSNHGFFLKNMGRTDEAEPLLRRAVADFREVGEAERDNLSAALEHWASALAALGEHDRAARAIEESLGIKADVHGRRSASYASALGNAAQIAGAAGDSDGQIRYNREALDALDELVLPDNGLRVTLTNNLAMGLRKRGDLDAAARQFRDVIRRAPDHLDAYQNLAGVLVEMGRAEAAADTLRLVYQMYRERFPREDAPTVAYPLLTLARIDLDAGRFAEAERSAREAARILDPLVPEGHPARLSAHGRVGAALVGQGRVREGGPLVRDAYRALKAALGSDARHTRDAARDLARLLEAEGEAESARNVRQSAGL